MNTHSTESHSTISIITFTFTFTLVSFPSKLSPSHTPFISTSKFLSKNLQSPIQSSNVKFLDYAKPPIPKAHLNSPPSLSMAASVENQNPWAPYNNYRDCSQGICSIYCPQFCYLIFPPPPPSDDDDSATPFSPLIIAVIGVLASAFLLVSYYTIATRYCGRRSGEITTSAESGENRGESGQDQWQGGGGLDETLIKTITVCKYQKGDGLIEGTECAVCLSEFQENKSLRLLPKCSHAFHIPCIDTWLKSQSSCPLCRAHVVDLGLPSPSPVHNSVNVVSSYEVQRPSDLVLVVDDPRRDFDDQAVVVRDDGAEDGGRGGAGFRRSVSLGGVPPHRQQLLVSDILRFEEIEEYMQVESDQLWRGIGSSEGVVVRESKSSDNRSGDGGLLRSPLAMKRSVSGGRFLFKVHEKGLPN